jgi:hypothetical protein
MFSIRTVAGKRQRSECYTLLLEVIFNKRRGGNFTRKSATLENWTTAAGLKVPPTPGTEVI